MFDPTSDWIASTWIPTCAAKEWFTDPRWNSKEENAHPDGAQWQTGLQKNPWRRLTRFIVFEEMVQYPE